MDVFEIVLYLIWQCIHPSGVCARLPNPEFRESFEAGLLESTVTIEVLDIERTFRQKSMLNIKGEERALISY